MKRFLITLIISLAATAAFSQKINFGIEAGIDNASQGPDGELMRYGFSHTSIGGFDAGAIMNITFHNLTIQPGLFYVTKGEKIPLQQSGPQLGAPSGYIVPEYDFSLKYLVLSALVLYNIQVIKTVSFHLGGGPYLGYGLFITDKTTGKSETIAFSSSSNYSIFKNPDVGFDFKSGITFINKILLDAQYGLGIANIGNPGYNIKNRVFGVSVGYLFK